MMSPWWAFLAGAALALSCGGGGPGTQPPPPRWDGGIGPVLSFAAPIPLVTRSPAALSVAVGDLDGDGRPDVVVGGVTGGIAVHRNLGGATFAEPVQYQGNLPPIRVALGDFDGDGRLDVAVVASDGGRGWLDVRLNDGGGGLGPVASYDAGGIPHAATVADLDRDGHDDVVVGNFSAGGALRGGLDGTLAAPTFYIHEAVHAVVAGDVDGDGWVDLVFAHGASNHVSVLVNRGGDLGSPTMFEVVDGPQTIALSDVDGDGRPDLIAGSFEHGLSVSLNLGQAAFGAPRLTPFAGLVHTVASADLDGDHRADVAAGSYPPSSTIPGRVGAMPGTADGGFGLPIAYRTSTTAIALGDLDGDGRQDIVGATEAGPVVLVNTSYEY